MSPLETVPLAEVAEVRLGRQRSPKHHSGDSMRPYLRSANVGWSGLLLDDVKTMNFTDKEMSVYRLRTGDLLLNEASGSPHEVGKPAIWNGEIEDCAIQNTLIRVRPTDRVEPRYLLHYFRYQASTGKFARAARGVGIHHLGADVLAKWPVPLRPRSEQESIAKMLDQADALSSRRTEALEKLALFVRATFQAMFSNTASPVAPRPITVDGERWERVPLRDVAVMGTGHTPDRSVPAYWNGDISWVNLNEIRGLDGRWCAETTAKITEAGVKNSSAVVHPGGTVCFSRTASIGFVTVMAAPMATSQDFVTWTCSDLLNPAYLMHALILSRNVLRASSSGSTHKTIYVRDAARFSVLLPPRVMQDEFVRCMDRADLLRRSMESERPHIEALVRSMQRRVFTR